MNISLKQFIIRIIIASTVLVLTGWIIFTFVVPGQYLSILPWMLVFFALFTIGLHGFQLRLAKKDMARFVRFSMIVTVVRLFTYSLFVIIFLAVDSENAAVFVVCIAVVYIVFSFIDVAELSRFSKQNNRQ